MNRICYDADFYGWANEQAALLREGRLAEADIANIAEEIESMGRSEKRELTSRLADNPSLKTRLPASLADAHQDAVLIAADETKLGETTFPPACPWSSDEIINPDFWPE